MKKVLYGIIAFDILAGITLFIILLGSNIGLAFLSAASSAVALVPLFALTDCLTRIENLETDLDCLRQKIRAQDRKNGSALPSAEEKPFSYSEQPKITAQSRWICSKCKSMNKSGTSLCTVCGARYTLAQETPEEMPLTKWKLKESKNHFKTQKNNTDTADK